LVEAKRLLALELPLDGQAEKLELADFG
jgi:hypothetical protein